LGGDVDLHSMAMSEFSELKQKTSNIEFATFFRALAPNLPAEPMK